MKKALKRFISILIVIALAGGLLYFAGRLLMPKYINDIIEGRLIEEYYDNAGGNDVIFVSDCECYENISPIKMYEEYGITSYIRGSSQQLIWQSYYLLEETLRYDTPKVVVFNVLSMKYNEPQNEAYNRMTLDGMRWSSSKWNSIKASMTDEEDMITYLFPLLRYHSRWSELTVEDFEYLFKTKKSFHQGYLMRVDVRPVTDYPTVVPLADYSFGDNAWYYLNKITALCKEKGIPLVLMKAPSVSPVWYDEWDSQIVEYARENDLFYINFLDLLDEVGINWDTDTYDNGLHLNLSGAEKLSVYFGKILQDRYGLADHRSEPETAEKWQGYIDFYNEMRDDQYRELEEYGYLKSYGGRKPE